MIHIIKNNTTLYRRMNMKLEITAKFTKEQLDVLKANGIPADPNNLDFYANVDIVPATQFSVDVLDAITLFIGGLYRGSQNGKHIDFGIPDSVKRVLMTYVPVVDTSNIGLVVRPSAPGLGNAYYRDLRKLHSATANAGYMIDELFGTKKVVNYLTAPAGAPIESFTI